MISFDLFIDLAVSLLPQLDYKLLPVAGLNSVLDMTISQYYRDVGDARNDLEYMLVKNQILLHSMDCNVNKALRLMQDHLRHKPQDMPQNTFHCHNAIFLTTDMA